MAAGPTIDANGFTLEARGAAALYVTFPSSYGVAELDAFLKELRAFFLDRGHGPFFILVDVAAVGGTNAMTRKRLGEFFEEKGNYFKANCRGMAIVTASAIQKGAVTAIFWLRPNDWNTKVFSDRGQAEAWLQEETLK